MTMRSWYSSQSDYVLKYMSSIQDMGYAVEGPLDTLLALREIEDTSPLKSAPQVPPSHAMVMAYLNLKIYLV